MSEPDRRRNVSAAMCGTCAYFHPDVTVGDVDYGQTNAGECRCHAPLRRAGDGLDADQRVWPIVYPNDWCGQFVPDTDG